MRLILTIDEALIRADKYMNEDNHCGPTVLRVMCDSYGLDYNNYSWATVNFLGGIGGNSMAACGALEGGAVALALGNLGHGKENPGDDAIQASREKASRLMDGFQSQFGASVCDALIPEHLASDEAWEAYHKSNEWQRKCVGYVRYVIEKIYELEGND